MAIYPDRSILGFEIVAPDPPQPWALIVRAEKRQKEWRVYSDHILDKVSPHGASTTIYYWDEPYRIEREVNDAEGWCYYMRPWPENEPMFHRIELSNASIESIKEAHREMQRDELKLEVSVLYDFIIGILPARNQIMLSQTMGFDPVEATRRNAVLCIVMGSCGAFFGIFAGVPLAIGVITGLMLMLDGIVRWAWVITDERVNGLLLWELIDRIPGWIFKKDDDSTSKDFDHRE